MKFSKVHSSFVVVLSLGLLFRATMVAASNEVLIPDYIEEKTEPVAPENKIQYEPANDEVPILEEKQKPEVVDDGVEYPSSKELFITVEPSFIKKNEQVVEAVSEESQNKVSESQSN